MSALLTVEELAIRFCTADGPVDAVTGVSFSLDAGETLAIVGESSSGKSVTALALMRLLGTAPHVEIRGRAILAGEEGVGTDLLALPEARMRAVRGRDMGMIFQEPLTSLNPVHRIGAQIAEGLRLHEALSARAAAARAVELLGNVGIPEPAARARAWPHELSGGMRQRAMIAMALACRPRILIADEPTTALDVTVQAQILDLIAALQRDSGMAVIFITHNLGVVADIADRVIVMYGGEIVETAPVKELLERPLMPYSAGLLGAVPRLEDVVKRGMRLAAIPGSVPDPRQRPRGCVFQPRCPHALPIICDTARPSLTLANADRTVRCARWQEIVL